MEDRQDLSEFELWLDDFDVVSDSLLNGAIYSNLCTPEFYETLGTSVFPDNLVKHFFAVIARFKCIKSEDRDNLKELILSMNDVHDLDSFRRFEQDLDYFRKGLSGVLDLHSSAFDLWIQGGGLMQRLISFYVGLKRFFFTRKTRILTNLINPSLKKVKKMLILVLLFGKLSFGRMIFYIKRILLMLFEDY